MHCQILGPRNPASSVPHRGAVLLFAVCGANMSFCCFGWAIQDLICCVALVAQPLTLHNVFVSNQGTRITLGRIPWAARVNADGSSCTTQLAARTRLLAQSFAQMLQDMLLASALPGVRRATGLNGSNSDVGKDEEKHGGGDEVGDGGKGVAPQKVFSRMQCMRGIHVRRGETFTVSVVCGLLRCCLFPRARVPFQQ